MEPIAFTRLASITTMMGVTRKEMLQRVTPVRTDPKINRNSPCPCGSGRKYKKCCINSTKP